MSLVTSAAPVNYNDNNNTNTNNNNNNNNTNKGFYKNSTYKNKNAKKIKKEMIEESYNDSDDETAKLEDFKPVQTTIHDDPINNPKYNLYNKDHKDDSPINSNEAFAKLDSTYAKDYYKQYQIPNNSNYLNRYSNSNSNYEGSYQIPTPSVDHNSELLKKLDNILYLLEEQQEEKTNLITEELILYVFLGVFVIYVLDSFVRVGKYVR
jgi:hypothetical protein